MWFCSKNVWTNTTWKLWGWWKLKNGASMQPTDQSSPPPHSSSNITLPTTHIRPRFAWIIVLRLITLMSVYVLITLSLSYNRQQKRNSIPTKCYYKKKKKSVAGLKPRVTQIESLPDHWWLNFLTSLFLLVKFSNFKA